MDKSYKLSQEAYDRLKKEYDDLTTRGRIEIAQKIETARELGDLSENGDYHAAKEHQGKMEGRIGHLGALIKDAVIVAPPKDGGVVEEGCVVTIQYEGEDEPEKYLIGLIEERREGLTVMSPGSPLGKTLLGSKKGETATFESPGGPLKVEIVDIEV